MSFQTCRLSSLLVAALVIGTLPGWAGQGRSGGHNEAQREQWQKVDQIFEAMLVKPGAVVADVGAGDGFFTKRLAAAVGEQGRVLAVDIGSDALRRLRARVADEALANVEVIEGAADDPKLPVASVDAVLIVNAYHEMNEHQAMLTKIRTALKPGGRLVIVEPIGAARRDSGRSVQTRNHEIAADFVREDARAAGFEEVAFHDAFAKRPHGNDEEWMLVLTPVSAAQVFSSKNDAWKAPELRITVEEFKQRLAAGDVLVLDVRDLQSYRQGHLPGAVLVTPEELATVEGAARLKGEKRLIVAYCS